MFAQPITQNLVPFTRAARPLQHHRFKELMPMCVIRIQDHSRDPSLLELARRCQDVLKADIAPEFDVVFVGLTNEQSLLLTKQRKALRLNTLGDWTRALHTFLSPGSDHCPNCGEKTFVEPVLFCSCCGANPGNVFERAGGVFTNHSP